MINSLYPKYYLFAAEGDGDGGGGDGGGGDGGGDDAPQDVTDIGYSPPLVPISPLVPMPTPVIPTFTSPHYSTQKEIRSIIIKDKIRDIDSNGETRSVTIKGNPGATFTLTATTASGCSILEKEIENFQLPSNGKHQVNIKFPKLDASATSDIFTIETKPAADSTLGTFIHADPKLYDTTLDSNYNEEELKRVKAVRNRYPIKDDSNIESITKLYQYKNPTVTFTNVSTQTSPALTATGSDITKTGKAKTLTRGTVGYTSTTYTLTIVEDPTDTAGSLYVKGGPNFNNNITDNKTIKKIVRREIAGETTSTSVLRLDPSTTITDSDGIITSDLIIGMKVKGCVSYTKTIVTSVGTDNCYLPVSEFKLLDTNNLFEGMIVSGKGVYGYPVTITNVDCNDNVITLSSRHVIKDSTILTFEHCINTGVRKVETNVDADGRACITIGESVVPDRMELSFTEDRTVVHGITKQSGSGGNSITLTTELDVIKFGEKDITYTLNLDNFITTTPNAYDQDILVTKDTATAIYLLKVDSDSNISSKTATVTSGPSHGTVGSWSTTAKTITYTPHTGFIGLDSFTFTMSDGTNSSEEKRVFITVN